MSTFYQNGISNAIQNGLSSLGDVEIVVLDQNQNVFPEDEGDGIFDQPQSFWSRSGSVLPPDGNTLGSMVASSDTSVEYLRYQDTSSGQQYFRISGGGETGIQIGEEVTIKTGSLDAIREAIAEILIDGIGAQSFTAELREGDGTVIDSQSINIDWSDADDKFYAPSDVTFTNGSGGSWSVEELRVVLGSGELLLSDTGISTSVADGGSITFTTIEQAISNLT